MTDGQSKLPQYINPTEKLAKTNKKPGSMRHWNNSSHRQNSLQEVAFTRSSAVH